MLKYNVYEIHKWEIIAIEIFMEGWKIKEAEYIQKQLLEDDIWKVFNYVFSSKSINNTSYKFGFLKAIIECVYEIYMTALYYWNRGDKAKLKNIYMNVKDGLVKWNGEVDKDHINIFMGKNQIKYNVSEEIELKANTDNLPVNDETNLKKFISSLKLKYKSEKLGKSQEIDVDFGLYKLLMQVNTRMRA